MFVVKFCLLCAFSLALSVSATWSSTITPEKNAFNRIKLLERQILLSEQIGVAVCLMLADVQSASQSDKARGAADLFASVQNALHIGDENMAILPETSDPVLQTLKQIDDVFYTFRAATLQLVNNDLHSVPASQVMRLDDVLMELVNNAVEVVAHEYGAASGDKAKRATQSLARQQTLLTQRLIKDMCYIMLDINTDAMRTELQDTISTFDTSQTQLRKGSGSGTLRTPPKPAAIKKLNAVDALWGEMAALARPATSQAPVTQDDLLKVLDLSNKLLFKTKQVARSINR